MLVIMGLAIFRAETLTMLLLSGAVLALSASFALLGAGLKQPVNENAVAKANKKNVIVLNAFFIIMVILLIY
jgi:hypothetical protein